MRTRIVRALAGVAVSLVAASALAQTPLFRLSASFDNNREKFTTAPPASGGAGGTVVFSQTVFQPQGKDTLFITISATADQHNGSKLLMSCTVDGALCGALSNPGSIGAGGGPSGWIVLQHTPGSTIDCNNGGGGASDCHDNALNFTFCAANVPNGARTVQLKLASQPGGDGNTVFYEGAHYYIDSTNMNSGAACSQIP